MKTSFLVWFALAGLFPTIFLAIETHAAQGVGEAEIQLEKEIRNVKEKSMATKERETAHKVDSKAVTSAAIQGKTSGGVTYIRWGNDECPKGEDLLYSGLMTGGYYNSQSGGSNFQCLTKKPQYVLKYWGGVQHHAELFGTEYYHSMVGKSSHNVPCAHCYVPNRNAKFMLPGGATCPKGWVREYLGYLMTARFWYHREYATYECVDREQRSVPGSRGCQYGTFLSYVEVRCSGAPCPPFDPQKELNCVVCTK